MYPMLYAELAELYDTLEKTSKRLEMTWHLAQAIGRTEEKDLGALLLLLQGRVLPPWDERKVGVAEKLVGKAISRATGASAKEVESLWAKRGDLGLVDEELSSKKRQSTLRSERLEVRGVLERVQGLTSLEGEGSVDRKVEEVSRLLSASPRCWSSFVSGSVRGRCAMPSRGPCSLKCWASWFLARAARSILR